MKKSTITVNTRLGTGGKWIVVARFNAGPRNLMRASHALSMEKNKNNGVGGYYSVLKIDDHLIGEENIGWDLTQAAAADILANPSEYLPT